MFGIEDSPFADRPLVSAKALSRAGIGGGRRDRTDDPLLAKQVLSQLSYAPRHSALKRWAVGYNPRQTKMVGLVGFEPTTPALSRRCSNRLSYRPLKPVFIYSR
jgi:hypothetical protein